MPFTALHPEVGRIDATQPDLGAGLEWPRVYKVSPRIPLTCPECAWGVHPKVSAYAVRFFCHDPGRPPECKLTNESVEHHMLKLEMADTIRAAGWYATLEVPAADGTWRADVMASSADGTERMAWEAQLSPITLDDIRERTERYEDEGIRVCWVSPREKPPRWIAAVPAVRVRAPTKRGEPWVVDDGLAGFDYRSGGWEFREAELRRFVRWALNGQVVPAESYLRYRRVHRLVDGDWYTFRRGLWWTSPQSVDAQDRHEAMRQRQELAREEREEQRKAEEERLCKEREEKERLRRAAEEERRRKEYAEAARIQAERWEQQRAEERERLAREKAAEEERAAREKAEREEWECQALETANAWWRRLSKPQVAELFAAVAERAWREDTVRLEIPEPLRMELRYAYGVPLYARDKARTLYGIVRPCPALVPTAPKTAELRLLVRTAQEAQELKAVLPGGRIAHLGLPEHEQLTMC